MTKLISKDSQCVTRAIIPKVIIVSFSALRDIFIGTVDAEEFVRKLLLLKSPINARDYLLNIHRFVFSRGDMPKDEIWQAYPCVSGIPRVDPIKESNLRDSNFIDKQASKLSFDISRFIDFLVGYTSVGEDIKPVMLHYSIIYLFDFFSRTWLKYGENWGHGIRLVRDRNADYGVKIQKSGIFQRAVDAFYFMYQSSLFSLDDSYGVQKDFEREYIVKEAKKMKYSDRPQPSLAYLTNLYQRSFEVGRSVTRANLILVGYVILFSISSLSRYRAEDWSRIRENRDLKSRLDVIQYDFLYEWTPEILMQTILKPLI